MGKSTKLTISLPEELVSLADKVARERRVSRSKVVSECLHELAEKRRIAEMEAGYKALADEQKRFAALAADTAHEVVPEWK